MVYFPPEILTDIVRRVGKSGFRELGAFIASGKDGRDAVFSQEVLASVDLDEFIFVSSLANEGSEYRSFFMKCFNAGNLTAMYVEGVRRAVKYGPSNESLELLNRTQDHSAYAAFAYGIFAICSGYYEEGILVVDEVVNVVSWLGGIIEIADTVMAQIADI